MRSALLTAVLAIAAAPRAEAQTADDDFGPRPQTGDPCADAMLGAIAAPVRDSGFDRGHGACLEGGLALRGRAAALSGGPVTDDTTTISGELELRWLYLADLELTVGARAVDHRLAGDSAVVDDDTQFGPVYLAAAAGRATRAFDRPLRLSWSLRLDLPWTTTGDDGAPTLAASPQVAAALRLGPHLAGHARIGALLWLANPPGGVDTRRALALAADMTWAPWRRLAGAIGVEAQSGWHGFEIDHLLARGGLRVPIAGSVRLELAGAAPLVGRESELTDLVVELSLIAGR